MNIVIIRYRILNFLNRKLGDQYINTIKSALKTELTRVQRQTMTFKVAVYKQRRQTDTSY